MIINSPTYGIFNILFDKDDYEKIRQYRWCINKYWNKNSNTSVKFYASTSNYKNKNSLLLHRFIMDAKKGECVDHINHIEQDNRKENLRLCNVSQNAMNKLIPVTNKSGHKGVFWDTFIPTPKWKANIKINQKLLHLGYFNTYEEAVIARENAERKYFGEFNSNDKIENERACKFGRN